MAVLSTIKSVLSVIWSILSFACKKIFWKNASIVYINDNKKRTNKRDLTKAFEIEHHKFINIYTDGKVASLAKIHLLLMKINQKAIIRNMTNQPDLYYFGFVSVPFAIYDGYSISDNYKIQLCDKAKNDSKTYSIEYKHKRIIQNTYSILNNDEINLVISSSYLINKSLIANGFHTYELNVELIPDKITSNYINDIYFKVLDFLDEASKVGVKRIHLFVASRQAVSFAIGSAIQARHPEIIVYEFDGTKYTWGLNFKTRKVIK